MPCNIAEPKKRKKDFIPRKTQPMKSHRLFVYYSPPTTSLYKKPSPSSCYVGLGCGSVLQTLNSNCPMISNKPIFAEEISGRVFISGQQHCILSFFCYIPWDLNLIFGQIYLGIEGVRRGKRENHL